VFVTFANEVVFLPRFLCLLVLLVIKINQTVIGEFCEIVGRGRLSDKKQATLGGGMV